jgi:hypothetical protein
MSEKIELKEKLAAVDLNARSLWDDMDDAQRKSLKNEFYILNRYVSSAANQSREVQEHFILSVNEYFNKHWNTLQKHPKLLWLLLCMCSYNGEKVFYHEWIGFKRKSGINNKKVRFLEEFYPDMRRDELELLSLKTTDKELKDLARQHGIDEATIAKKLK